MRRKSRDDVSVDHTPATRLIDMLVSTFLFLTLLLLFGTVFTKLFGTTDVAWVGGRGRGPGLTK
jgi:hypothetical protein